MGGVVVAAELRPFLEDTTTPSSVTCSPSPSVMTATAQLAAESTYMLPILSHLSGHPIVSSDGTHLAYTFPLFHAQYQRLTYEQRVALTCDTVWAQEPYRQFSCASEKQLTRCIGLGAFNLVRQGDNMTCTRDARHIHTHTRCACPVSTCFVPCCPHAQCLF